MRRILALILLMVGLAVTGCATAGQAPPAARVPEPRPDPPAATAELTKTDVDAWLDGLVPTALRRSGIAGATVSVVHDGKVVTARGYGLADTGTGDQPARAVDPEQTLFRVGSVSKVVTATAAMQLVEQGRLDLDAPIARYLDFDLAQPKGPVTLRHLLTHTAGFEERIRPLIEPPGTRLDLREFVAVDPPVQVYAPGTTPAYSNYGNSLVGYLVERVSGQSFADYVQQRIFAPAGMGSSTFAQPLPDALTPRLSAAYADDAQAPTPFEMITAAPAGAFTTTAPDMGRFMLAQLGDGPAGRSLLKPETLAQMQQPGLDADALGAFAAGPRMTLGLFAEDRNGRRVVGHDGDTTVFHSAYEILPDDGAGIFISMNSSGRGAADSLDLRGAVMRGFTDRYFPGDPAPAAVPAGSAERAAAAAGTYESSRVPFSTFMSLLRLNGQTTVTAEPDGTLLLSPGPNGLRPVRFAEIAPSVWREVGGQQVITLRRPSADGRVDAIGHSSAFTLLRTDPAHRASVVLPVVIGSLAVLVISMVAWPVAALVRRRYEVGTPVDPARRTVRALRRVGIAAVVLATVGWLLLLRTTLGYAAVSDGVIRPIQVLQAIGILGVVPAALHLVSVVRQRARWTVVLGSGAVLLALVAMAWFAVTFRLVGLDVSY